MPEVLTIETMALGVLCLSVALFVDALAQGVRIWWQEVSRRQRARRIGLSRSGQ